uniref:Putative nucleoporin 50 n=1 Tax=Corethrella appendiculata TaxID=1370023 RepID=U5EZQ4_9DIPT
MSKRRPVSDLNHDNWNEEEDLEEAGQFAKASEDVLQKRVIKQARRRIAGGEGTGTGGAFSGFAGFSKITSTTSDSSTGATASPFSFLAKVPTTNGTKDKADSKQSAILSSFAGFGKSTAVAAASTTGFSLATTTTTTASTSFFPKALTSTATTSTAIDTVTSSAVKKDDYFAKIKELNQSVSKWIQKHVDENPICKLTPIFKDYEKYLEEIESEELKTAASPPSTTTATVAKESDIKKAATTSSTMVQAQSPKPISDFKFGSTTSPLSGFAAVKSDTTKPAFSFGSGSSTPFTFGNVSQPAATIAPAAKSSENNDDEGEYHPPKAEYTPVEEKDYIYSKRCKLFVKQESEYSDRGIGTLYIKQVDGKTQVLLRAETSLGNILLNIILNESIPTQRLGKNNVMLVCLPTPDSKPPPTPILLRVKTAEEADELLNTLEKYKK